MAGRRREGDRVRGGEPQGGLPATLKPGYLALVVSRSNLSFNAKTVLQVLIERWEPTRGTSFPSTRPSIAAQAGCSESTVKRAAEELKAAKVATFETEASETGRTLVWTLHPAAISVLPRWNAADTSGHSDRTHQVTVTGSVAGGPVRVNRGSGQGEQGVRSDCADPHLYMRARSGPSSDPSLALAAAAREADEEAETLDRLEAEAEARMRQLKAEAEARAVERQAARAQVLAAVERHLPGGADLPVEVEVDRWLDRRWPVGRILFGLARATLEHAGRDGTWRDPKKALNYAKGAMEGAQPHEWQEGAERPDNLRPMSRGGQAHADAPARRVLDGDEEPPVISAEPLWVVQERRAREKAERDARRRSA